MTAKTMKFLTILLASSGLSATIATTPAAAQTVGIDAAGRDLAVKPGDDFDAYANGGWRAKTEIPADRASTGTFLQVFEKAEKRNAELIQGAAAANPAAGTDLRKIADFYAAYMDEAAIEARGAAPLAPQFSAIAAIRTRADLSRALGATLRADVDPLNATNFSTENLFGLFVAQALDDPSVTMPYLLQGGLGMPDREYYVSATPEMAELRGKYLAYIGDMLALAGVPDARVKAQRVYDLELKIAQAHLNLTDSQDVHKANNRWSKADFSAKAPGIDWNAYFDAAQLGGQQSFIVWQPTATAGLAALVAGEPLDAWKDWMTFHAINHSAPNLPKAYVERSFAFFGTALSGTPKMRDRWKRGLGSVNAHLGDAVGKAYVARYFPAEAKADVQAMVKNILAAFDRRVEALGWMAPATKAEARRKIGTLQVGVGYPETWRNYAALDIRADDPVGNALRAEQFEYRHQIAKLGQPVDRGEWWMTPQTVNAVNLPLQNALNFPAAILEAPFYNPKADAAANYGSIGAVIGHEISHSFDNSGAEFDATGRMNNWWTAEDMAHFKAQGEALVKQYDAYQPFPGVHVNGALTLGENIADVAGLAAAYDAYRASLGGKPAPVIDGLTGDQRFFLAFAHSWRQKIREAALRAQIVGDGHAPGAYRAQTVRNLDGRYDAFNAKPGEGLYLAPADRVRIW